MSDKDTRPIWGWEDHGPELFQAAPIPSDALTPLPDTLVWRLLPEQILPLQALRRTGEMVRAAEATRESAVDAARDLGVSWGTIGVVLGMTDEGARRKFTKRRK